MNEPTTSNELTLAVNLNQSAITQLSEQRVALKEFISNQLKPGIDNDYAVIPGTKKQSLLQPGAEKIANLFGLGSRIVDSQQTVDIHTQFAMFSYTIEIYHLKTDTKVAQVQGSANNMEVKYQNVPFGRVLNTLQKMAQKRAYVGAVIRATGASDFLTQDMEDFSVSSGPTRAKASVPNATSAQRSDSTSAPNCCNRPMMVSKFDDSKFYCPSCKNTIDRK